MFSFFQCPFGMALRLVLSGIFLAKLGVLPEKHWRKEFALISVTSCSKPIAIVAIYCKINAQTVWV